MKKVLPVAVLAAMAGVNGAQAVHVNPDGLGQVLVYPYYTTTEGQDTYINLVNTTDEFKAVKVRILESLNSEEVLDFNLYLSPQDHWSATITADPEGPGAVIFTQDASCTVPNRLSNGEVIPFRNFQFVGEDTKDGLDRTREGYVEVIEMVNLENGIENWADFIKHVDGVPGDCGALDDAWEISPQGAWRADSNDGALSPSGGLYGYGVLINVDEGTDATYDALALDNFWETGLIELLFHTSPGDLSPGLSNSSSAYDVIDGNDVIDGVATATGGVLAGTNAVSALITHNTISNDYVLEEDLDAGTDWVITFPTKRDYVAGGSAVPPFQVPWSSLTSTACEEFSLNIWDREEGTPQDPPSQNDFSPLPPNPEVLNPTLCAEANVLTFNGSNVLAAPQSRNGNNVDLEMGFENGWARIDFVSATGRPPLQAGDNSFSGLPVIGFAVQKYVNGDVNGLLSNYVGNVTHKATRSVSSAP